MGWCLQWWGASSIAPMCLKTRPSTGCGSDMLPRSDEDISSVDSEPSFWEGDATKQISGREERLFIEWTPGIQ